MQVTDLIIASDEIALSLLQDWPNIRQNLKHTAEKISKALSSESCAILEVADRSKERVIFEVLGGYAEEGSRFAGREIHRLSKSITAEVLDTKTCVRLNNIPELIESGRVDKELALIYINKRSYLRCYEHFLGVPLKMGNESFGLIRAINKLNNHGLHPEGFSEIDAEFLISLSWKIANILNMEKLYSEREYLKDTHIPAKPIWKRTNFEIDKELVFVLMPFGVEELDEIFENHIKDVVVKLGLRCERADYILDVEEIVEDIWESICTAQFLIADLTGSNPNVLYELGIAHTLGKRTIIIIQEGEKVPIDIENRRHIRYNPKNIERFKIKLRGTIRNLLRKMEVIEKSESPG
ncbi:MAG: hypothetical protein ACFFCW_49630 [Candidatus Hodarchaeota archaeon]